MRGAPLLVLGCGFAGLAAARQALAEGRAVTATTRQADRARELAALGIEPVAPDASALAARVTDETEVLVAFPPDGAADAALAPAVGRAAAIVYLSTTGVYGEARGRVDEATPIDAASARAAPRLAAERVWRDVGACVLRPAGIYGPGRGMHLRIRAGTWRVGGDGSHTISRIHVDDLASLALAALRARLRGETYVVGDARPVPQIEAVRWLCERMGVPAPPFVPLSEVHESLRQDRRVDGGALRARLGVELRYPTYREGFEACLAAEADGVI